MEERAGSWWAQATDVAGALVREKGLSWRTAHQIVGILVRFTYERGIAPKDTTPELLDEAAIEYFGKPVNLSGEALKKVLDPRSFVEARTLFGGPSPEEAEKRLFDYAELLYADRNFVEQAEQKLSHAKDMLEEAVTKIIGS